jgi:hypothetical protein
LLKLPDELPPNVIPLADGLFLKMEEGGENYLFFIPSEGGFTATSLNALIRDTPDVMAGPMRDVINFHRQRIGFPPIAILAAEPASAKVAWPASDHPERRPPSRRRTGRRRSHLRSV